MVGATKRLIAAIPKQVIILQAVGPLAWGGIKGANQVEFVMHRHCTKIQNCCTKWGLTNNLH